MPSRRVAILPMRGGIPELDKTQTASRRSCEEMTARISAGISRGAPAEKAVSMLASLLQNLLRVAGYRSGPIAERCTDDSANLPCHSSLRMMRRQFWLADGMFRPRAGSDEVGMVQPATPEPSSFR